MKILVTGGAGFIGSALARALLLRGDEVTILDDLSTSSASSVPAGAALVRGDVRDPEAAAHACAGAEVVLHQAALRSVPRSVDDPMTTNDVNVTGTLTMLEAAANAGCRRFVYASSSSVYGDAGDVQVETMSPRPLSPYAVSKLAGEQYALAWSALGRISTISLRYFNVFGPGQRADSRYAAVFPAFVAALRAGRAPEVHGDGEQTRDFTFVDDVVAANISAALVPDPGQEGRVVNVAAGRPRSVNEVLKAISAALGVWIEPEHTPRRAGDVRSTHADVTRARELLAWRASAEWDDAVNATVAGIV